MAKRNFKTIYRILFTICFLTSVSLSTAMAQVAVVNAAHFFKDGGTGTTAGSGIVTPDGLASAFAAFNITAGQPFYVATPGQALPKILGGVKVTINGTDADLLFVGPTQINFVVPANAPTGAVQTITVTNANATTSTGLVRIESFAPGIISAKSDGTGVAAANWTIDGSQPYPSAYSFTNNQFVHVNLDAGTKVKPTYLILYGTGIRNAPNTNTANDFPGLINVAESCKVTIGGITARVDYAGKQQFFAGLDQINVVIPPELASTGIVNVRIEITNSATAVTRASNAVEIKLLKTDANGKPIYAPINIIKTLAVVNGETVAGNLNSGDDIEQDPVSGKLYFIDVYSFTTTQANTGVTIDLRANLAEAKPLDTTVILRKPNVNGGQTFIGADDQGGGLGNGKLEANNNSLFFTVLQDPGEYWIFVTSADVAPLDTGSYTLKLSSGGITPLTYGQTVNGSFTASTKVQTAAGVYVDAYSFTGTEAEAVQITMRSSVLDSFLILRERNGDEITLDDNTGGGFDARISKTLPVNLTLTQTRSFIIVATPLEINRTGAYTLNLIKTSGLTSAPVQANTEFSQPSRVVVSESDRQRRSVAARMMLRHPIEKEQ